MSFEGVSHLWTTAAFENDSSMDVTLDRGGEDDNNFLRPMPRSMVEDGASARAFEDEDMIDLSPRPFPHHDMDDAGHNPEPLDLAQSDTAEVPQPEAKDTNGSANDLDEITYDDEEDDDNTTPSGPDATLAEQNVQYQNPDPAVAFEFSHEEDDEEPDLIDYGDDDDEIEPPQHETTTDNTRLQEHEYFDDHIDSHTESFPEGEAVQNDAADENNTVKSPLERKESEESPHRDSAYDKDAESNFSKPAEKQHQTEDHPKYSSHPIIIDYYNQWISLFKGSLPEIEPSFNVEEEILYGNISLTFEHIRKSAYVDVKEWEHLDIHVPALDLWIREKSDDADQYSFADLLNTYLDLHSHDGHYAPDPLFLSLTVRPLFRHQLEQLQRVSGSGGGFSKCEFLRSSQPNFHMPNGDSGESGEDNEQYSQQYEADEEKDEPVQSAISTVSSHPADPSSTTLTGQSNTPGELLTGEGYQSSHEDYEAVLKADDEEQYGHDAPDNEDFGGETYNEDGHDHDQHYEQDYDESANNQDNSEFLDIFQGNDQEYQQHEDGVDQPAEEEGLEIYEDDHQNLEHDHQDLQHDHGLDAAEQAAEQANDSSKNGRGDDHPDAENASTGQDGDNSLAFETEGQEYLEAYNQTADDQYYDQQEAFIVNDIAQEGFGEYDQSLHHTGDDQPEGQYQSYEDNNQNGNGADHVDGSEGVEGDFLIDYSDTEEIPPQDTGIEQVPELDQGNTPEDDINYFDEEDVNGKTTTPTKRPRSDDDLEIEAKRLKAEAT